MCFSRIYIFIASHLLQRKYKKVVNPYCILKILSSLSKKMWKSQQHFCLSCCLLGGSDRIRIPGTGMFRTAAAPSANNKKTNFCSETLKLALNWPLTYPVKRGHIKPLFCTLLRKFHVMTSTYFQNWGSNSGWNWTVVVKLKPQQKNIGWIRTTWSLVLIQLGTFEKKIKSAGYLVKRSKMSIK